MTLKLGVTLPQFTDDAAAFRSLALKAEKIGLDSIWVFDHLWPLSGGKERPILECWSTLAWLAGVTERITIGTLVTRSSLRHPAVIGKMAATIGAIAPGRLVVTMGSGDELSRDENEAFSLPYHSGEDRTDEFRSTLAAIVAYLSSNEVTQEDDFVSLRELPTSPRIDPRPEVWVGGRSAEMLEAAADLADGWNGWGGAPEHLASDIEKVRARAEREVTMSWGGLVLPDESDEAARARLKGDVGDRIVGGPETVATELARFHEAGASHLIATHIKGWDESSLELYADIGARMGWSSRYPGGV